MLKKLAAGLMLCFAATASVAAFAKELPKEQPKELTLMLEWFINPDHGPIIVAQQKGYFEQEGVKVTIQEPADPDLPPKLVAANDVDLAVYYQPSLIQAASEGLPLAWAGTLVATPLDGLIVLKDGPIKSLADMKGKSIGFSVNGSEKAILDTMFKPYGFGAEDVKTVNVGWNLSSSLMTGRVDALLGAYRNFELNSLELHKNSGKMFFIEEHGVPPYDELIFIANSKTADKEAIRRFLRAVERGAQFIANNPEEGWKVFRDSKPEALDNDLNRMAWIDTADRFALRPAAVDKGRYQRYAEFLKEFGEIKQVPDLKTMMLELY
ncbi:ABC transporter substrate-binding protein [Parendozoicomonas haliclonae]|uniref:Putative thiamine biosynthesis protein n=1 Tax=Parendozoicomonas haliclonae TaxID=1960125 RepID=A0A1X7ANH7_9GAMM|nr:ABC transporter substrate-binding protein [Parendozoicomonas haliclonae]SMA49825.1 putative thiamine biosynthesis protein [Parendozoicomonas haliclonae]